MKYSNEKKEFIKFICSDWNKSPDFANKILASGYSGNIIQLSDDLCLKIGSNTTKKDIPESFKRCKNLCVPLKIYASPSGKYIGYVQRYLNLYNVQKLIKDGIILTETKAAKIVFDILVGLEELHSNGYLHRDLHLGNIMLNSQDGKISAVIIDLDEMEKIGPETKACFRYSGYHAPEIVLHDDVYDEKSEIFAVGIILWELILGKCPFAGYDFFGRYIEISWDYYIKNKSVIEKNTQYAIKHIMEYKNELHNLSAECAEFLWALINPCREDRVNATEALRLKYLK